MQAEAPPKAMGASNGVLRRQNSLSSKKASFHVVDFLDDEHIHEVVDQNKLQRGAGATRPSAALLTSYGETLDDRDSVNGLVIAQAAGSQDTQADAQLETSAARLVKQIRELAAAPSDTGSQTLRQLVVLDSFRELSSCGAASTWFTAPKEPKELTFAEVAQSVSKSLVQRRAAADQSISIRMVLGLIQAAGVDGDPADMDKSVFQLVLQHMLRLLDDFHPALS